MREATLWGQQERSGLRINLNECRNEIRINCMNYYYSNIGKNLEKKCYSSKKEKLLNWRMIKEKHNYKIGTQCDREWFSSSVGLKN